MGDLRDLPVQTETGGDVPAVVGSAVEKVRSALRAAHEAVLFVRVRLTAAAGPAVERPAVAQVDIDLNGYRLAQADPRPRRLGPLDPSITVSEIPAPVLTLAEATTRLEALGRPFLFFVDAAAGRGNLLYRRYDGHYGLITPANAKGLTPPKLSERYWRWPP